MHKSVLGTIHLKCNFGLQSLKIIEFTQFAPVLKLHMQLASLRSEKIFLLQIIPKLSIDTQNYTAVQKHQGLCTILHNTLEESHKGI